MENDKLKKLPSRSLILSSMRFPDGCLYKGRVLRLLGCPGLEVSPNPSGGDVSCNIVNPFCPQAGPECPASFPGLRVVLRTT